MKEYYLRNGKKCTLQDIKPGTIEDTPDLRLGWTIENEIAWLEFHIRETKKLLVYREAQLEKMLAKRAWWARFLAYCLGDI